MLGQNISHHSVQELLPSDLRLPASKRVALEKQTEHCSAIDDVIHAKHIGW